MASARASETDLQASDKEELGTKSPPALSRSSRDPGSKRQRTSEDTAPRDFDEPMEQKRARYNRKLKCIKDSRPLRQMKDLPDMRKVRTAVKDVATNHVFPGRKVPA